MNLVGYVPTLSEVAKLFGKSSRWISDLRAKGELPPDGATLGEFVAAWTSLQTAGLKTKPIDQAKARREVAKAEREEIQTAALKGEMLPRGPITQAVQGAFARVRGKLLGLPSKIAPQIAGMTSEVAVEEAVTELVHEALAELAATVPTVSGPIDLASGGDAGDRGGSDDLVAGVHATAETDSQPVGGPAQEAKPRGKRRAGTVEDQPG